MESLDGDLKQNLESSSRKPSSKTLFGAFLRLGLTAFGGPAMVAYIKDMAVTRRKWLNEGAFSDGVMLCQSIPGATAMQMAAYVGLITNGLRGGLSAYAGFMLPAFTLMLILSIVYSKSHNIPQVVSLFNGLQVIVVALIANAAYTFGRDILKLKDYRIIILVLISAALLWLSVSPFIVIVGAALIGAVLPLDKLSITSLSKDKELSQGTFRQFIFLFLVVTTGLMCLYFIDLRLFSLAVVMLKIDLFAFGGAFASIPLMLHEVVHVREWLDSKTLMDGIALGQVTPGPIVITATFVGYLMHGFSGAIIATLAIFTPSFLILFGIMPFYSRIRCSPFFFKVSKSILATFVGLLLYATLKFASVVAWDTVRVSLLAGALVALLNKIDILYVVLICSLISVFIF